MDIVSATGPIAVFGGSGATGRALIAHALDKGLRVRALARNAASISADPCIEVLQGELSDAGVVRATLQGCRAAICVFGPRPPYADIFCAQATATIVAAMGQLGIRRLVCQTGGMIGEYRANRTLPFQLMANMFWRHLPLLAEDREGQERVVMRSGLAWTIVKPPRLTAGRATGRWTAGTAVRVGMLSSITRQDLAAFLLAEALMPQHVAQAVFIRG